jgi:hypothetical protein
MYPYSLEELAWAVARAIKEEVQQTGTGSVEKADESQTPPSPKLSRSP